MSQAAPPITRSARHVKAARARWGTQRIVRLDELDADTRRLVLALIANAQASPRRPAAPMHESRDQRSKGVDFPLVQP